MHDRARTSDGTFDIAVIGGGPAGCAAALAARSRGLSVALVHREPARGTWHAVERVAGVSRQYLSDWGLLHKLVAPVAMPCSSVVSAWCADQAPTVSYGILDPYGGGWIVERDLFDGLLRTEAIARGAVVLHGTVVSVVCGERQSEVRYLSERVSSTVRARRIVMAPGRGSALIRTLTNRNNTSAKWVAILGRLLESDVVWAGEPFLFVERTWNGWMYGMPGPAGNSFFGVCVPATLLGHDSVQEAKEVWLHSVSRSRIRPMRNPDAGASIWCRSMTGRAAAEVVGDHWAIVGDAARAVDPLSGLGTAFALESGWQAVMDPGAYQAWVQSFGQSHDESRQAFYGT